ncbi:MAG TPA: peptidylprolyl isomerase [Clostridia bacterium]|nr:peptidylprolyl isomerase [Clostridia bacterium]
MAGCAQKDVKYPTVTMKIKGRGDIVIELYPEKAPETVANFVSLVEDGFYDGLTFHRIIPGFMIQGGDPEGTGTGGPGYSIKGEFADNGFEDNDLKHLRGVISMARSQHPDSAGSQFFIMHDDSPHLDGAYAAFGKAIKGMDVVDAIAKTPTDMRDYPTEAQVIKKATVQLPPDYEKEDE